MNGSITKKAWLDTHLPCILIFLAFIPRPAVAADDENASQRLQRPRYHFLRETENWSVLKDADSTELTDFWDPIKYIDLGDGLWLSLGGHGRVRFENHDNFRFGKGPIFNDEFLLIRTALHADLHFRSAARAFLELKAAHSTNRDLPGGQRTSDIDALDIEKGFVDFSWAVTPDMRLTLRSGRQGLKFQKLDPYGKVAEYNTPLGRF